MLKKLFQIQIISILFLLSFHLVTSVASDVKLGNPIFLSSALTGDKVYQPKVAYNSQHKEYLVVYHWSNAVSDPTIPKQIIGVRVSVEGEFIDNFQLSDLTNDNDTPDVAYDPINDRYLVVWRNDINDDGSNWDLYGRFIPWDGPDAGTVSFAISQKTLRDENNPRLVYGETQKDFLVVTNLWPNDASSTRHSIIGLRIKADGSGLPNGGTEDFMISSGTETRVNPAVTYNSIRDEYFMVYDNGVDIFAQKIKGLDASPIGTQIVVAADSTDTENIPSVSFSSDKDIYVTSWDSKKLTGFGEVHGRFINGDGSLSTAFRLDDDIGGVRPDYTSTVACEQAGNECLVYWIAVNASNYYTFGVKLRAGDSRVGIGSPFTYLNSVASWGGDEPQISSAGSAENFFMAFKSNAGGSAVSIWGQPTLPDSFHWELFLPAITRPRGN